MIKQAFDKAKGRIIRLVLFSSIISLMTLSGSIYMLQVYDRVLPARSYATLAGLSAILLFIYILQGFFDALRVRMLARIGVLFEQALQKPIFDVITTMRLQGWDSASVTQPIRDLEIIRLFLSSMGPTAFLDLPWIPIFIIALYIFHPLIGAAATFGIFLIVGITYFIEWRTKKHAIEVTKLGMLRNAIAYRTASNAEVIHALGMRECFADQWREINDNYVTEIIRVRDIEADMGSIAKMFRYILQSAILGLGALLVITEHATAGIMIASSIMMGRGLAPIEVALGSWKQFKLMREALARLTNTLSINAAPTIPAIELERPSINLSVKDLVISPPGSNLETVKGISFDAIPGTGLAIVGHSGAGETSLARALANIWKPKSGLISLDCARISHWDSDKLGSFIGYLPQDVALFSGTIAQNIARFKKDVKDSEVLDAARIAGCHDLIIGFPEGYSKEIGENGSHLSAGQRQRIALARAVFGNPFMVILDEPNANLDAAGEMALTETILRLREQKCIVIVISHRMSSLSAMNQVLILSNGRILMWGPRENVLAALNAHNSQPQIKKEEPKTDEKAITQSEQQ